MTQRAADRHIEIIPLRVGYHSADLIVRVSGNVQDVPIRLSPMLRGINFWIQENSNEITDHSIHQRAGNRV